ncbi:T9SS type A sorting domain-containing protein [Chryseobacterium sp.]|uniref:T9SS type A sorting domain-containing protein n=1 Tax=Chryseobacterium sp. TaxID=1871047 RepID=UPI00333ED4FB
MKKLNSILCILIGITGYAQPSITRSAVDQINVTRTYKAGDVPLTATQGPSGANVSWDFSVYNAPNVSSSITNECPGQSNCFRFPGANRITKPTLSDVYDFNSVSDAEAVMLGSYAGAGLGDVTITYTDPLIDFKFPITYLQQFTDNYELNTVSGSIGSSSESGQVVNNADAYGTITTPAGTFSNVIRVKKMRTGTQTVPGSSPLTYTNEAYLWISQSAGIVFSFAINTFELNGTTHVTKSISYSDAGALSTIDPDTGKSEISVYPNPSSDCIRIQSKEEIRKISVTSLDGKVVATGTSDNTDISKLPKGIYILQSELKNGQTISKKIIKK